MTPLTRNTVEKLIEMMQADFMLRADLGKFVAIWHTRLSEAGLQEEDAHKFYQWFLKSWNRQRQDRKPFLNDLVRALGDSQYGKQKYWEAGQRRDGVASPERATWWLARIKEKLKTVEKKWTGKGKGTCEVSPERESAPQPHKLRWEQAENDLPPKEMD